MNLQMKRKAFIGLFHYAGSCAENVPRQNSLAWLLSFKQAIMVWMWRRRHSSVWRRRQGVGVATETWFGVVMFEIVGRKVMIMIFEMVALFCYGIKKFD